MGKKVLVVDDEKLIVKGIRFSLEQDGMEVDCAYDGEEALECVQNKEYDSALEVIDFCESTIEEVIGTNNLDYGLCEFYRGVIAYTRSQPVIAEQHLLNADAVFHDVMNENPDNDYSKSTARYLYSLYMRWGRKELAEQYNKILISTH